MLVANSLIWNRITPASLPRVADAMPMGVRHIPAAPKLLNKSVKHQQHQNHSLRIPAYRIHKTKNLGYTRIQARMIYLGRAESPESKALYRRVLAEWLASGRVSMVRRRAADDHAALSIDQMVDAYLTWARDYYIDVDGHPSSGVESAKAAAKVVRELYGATLALTFGPVALKAIRQAMIDQALCRNVINQRIGRIKRIFRWAAEEEQVPASVAQALSCVEPLQRGRSGARETEPVRPVPDQHVAAILPFLPPTVSAMVQLQRLTGMRSGEVCRLRTCDVYTRDAVWSYKPMSHKTAYRGHDRIIRIGPKGQEILRPWLRHDKPDAAVFSPRAALRERLKCTRRNVSRRESRRRSSKRTKRHIGSSYNSRSYHRALRYAMLQALKAGVMTPEQFWHPHQLRHRHATDVRQARGLEAARVLLGHRSLAQTLEYAEADAGLATSVAGELG